MTELHDLYEHQRGTWGYFCFWPGLLILQDQASKERNGETAINVEGAAHPVSESR